MADQEELEEALRKIRVENGEIEEGESGDDEGEEEENPFQEFVPGGFVGRAASVDEDYTTAYTNRVVAAGKRVNLPVVEMSTGQLLIIGGEAEVAGGPKG